MINPKITEANLFDPLYITSQTWEIVVISACANCHEILLLLHQNLMQYLTSLKKKKTRFIKI